MVPIRTGRPWGSHIAIALPLANEPPAAPAEKAHHEQRVGLGKLGGGKALTQQGHTDRVNADQHAAPQEEVHPEADRALDREGQQGGADDAAGDTGDHQHPAIHVVGGPADRHLQRHAADREDGDHDYGVFNAESAVQPVNGQHGAQSGLPEAADEGNDHDDRRHLEGVPHMARCLDLDFGHGTAENHKQGDGA